MPKANKLDLAISSVNLHKCKMNFFEKAIEKISLSVTTAKYLHVITKFLCSTLRRSKDNTI